MHKINHNYMVVIHIHYANTCIFMGIWCWMGKTKPKIYNKKANLTWGIYGMEHNRRDFHRMDDDVQRKRLKRIHCCHDLTNNRKNHPVLAPQLCSTVALISNTNKCPSTKKNEGKKMRPHTRAMNEWIILVTVHTPTRWHDSVIMGGSNVARFWQKYLQKFTCSWMSAFE